jgi:hypothetical protein
MINRDGFGSDRRAWRYVVYRVGLVVTPYFALFNVQVLK